MSAGSSHKRSLQVLDLALVKSNLDPSEKQSGRHSTWLSYKQIFLEDILYTSGGLE